MRARRWLAVAAIGAVALAACGDDDDDDDAGAADAADTTAAAETTAAGAGEEAAGADSEYCQLAVAFNEAPEATVEALDALVAAAPDEIADEVAVVAPIFRDAIAVVTESCSAGG